MVHVAYRETESQLFIEALCFMQVRGGRIELAPMRQSSAPIR